MKTSSDHNPILVRKIPKQIEVSRGGYISKYDISTNIIYTIEVVTGPSGTEVKIKQDNDEIGFEYRSHKDWDGIWGGELVAIEYPNKDLWSEHPVLNELKLTSLVPMAGVSGNAPDSNEKSSTEEQMEKKKGNYIVFPNTERFILHLRVKIVASFCQGT